MHPQIRIFLFALAGSITIEALKIVRIYEAGKPLPARYRRVGFWFSRTVLACGAGVLAVAVGNPNDYLAFYIGASFPAFLQNVSQHPSESLREMEGGERPA